MDSDLRGDVTALLGEARVGSDGARDRLLRLVYGELRRMDAGLMRSERADHTLQPSALVHEVVLRHLDGDALIDAPNRPYLFAAAAQAMRQILVDHARRRLAAKRVGGGLAFPSMRS
jgi:RNA polymerase sigma factor (TIGR02999 family)